MSWKTILTRVWQPAASVAVLVCVMLVGIDLGVLHLVLSQRAQAIEQALSESRNVTTLLAKQTDRAFQSIDVVERNIIDKLRRMGVTSADDLRWMASQRVIYDQIAGEAKSLDFVSWFTILDDKGQVVSTSRQWPRPDYNFSNRDYFRALSSQPNLDTFISEPIANLQTGELSIYVVRKIRSPDGRFAGVVIGGVKTGYFTDIYDAISIRPGSAVFLIRDDGIVLSQSGNAGLPISFSVMRGPYRDMPGPRRPTDVIFSDSESSGRMMNAVAHLERYPLRVVAGVTLDAVLATWRSELRLVGLIVVVVNASILLAGLLSVRQLRESERISRAEHHSSRHDILTGLPNRSFFQETLAAIRRSDPTGGAGFGLILLDLDNFKEVNDTEGHLAGDELLRMVARRLAPHIGSGDLLARLGGDEFAILQSSVSDQREIIAFGHLILAQFRQPFEIKDRLFTVGASLGAAFGRPGDDEAQLFDQADMALYQAKEAGRDTMRFFSPELNRLRQEQKKFVLDLRSAIEEEAFHMHYQPIIDLGTCRLTAFEALLRWNHPERGAVPPCDFIPVAETSGLIRPLGAFALRQACRQATAWPKTVKLAVNLSSVQIQAGDVVADVEAALRESGLSAGRLEIEITESVLLDAPRALPILHELRALGVAISLDDFGTGYSSLSYLRSFPFQRLKIDRSFVSELPICREAGSIVRSIKDLADRLGMAVTAEGVETNEQLRWLQALGPMNGQGYLLSRPVPAGETAMLVREYGVVEEAPPPLRLVVSDQAAR